VDLGSLGADHTDRLIHCAIFRMEDREHPSHDLREGVGLVGDVTRYALYDQLLDAKSAVTTDVANEPPGASRGVS
jgi:hypothetical protein